ncbi:cytochrome c-type biogenesis protein CcmF [Geoglobus ahangari]|uniref:Cytochrome c-type biogenesis protein CcmF n=1 Tax=Geoglobus ahangari TaxID=113653 RepID=A0A0F7IDN6_9EURY|nr:cytochrome c-type biogenesis CcmF C-terminal domain-containing protein [Geoglobus ahangari]AKG91589.1 cytochrome c-type biogenesis protein CcmF [Geoglobus ahangari]
MNAGYVSILLALAASLASLWGLYSGVRNRDAAMLRFGERAIYATILFVTLASAILTYYFLTDSFWVEYVASYSSRNLPDFYKLTAFWAGSDGSLLLWTLILAGYIYAYLKLERKDLLSAYTLLAAMSVMTFFLFLLSTVSNPFEELGFVPADGIGLNPLLQTPEMVVHPPTLFLGYAGSAIVFALAISGVLLADDRWVFRARKWIVFTWIWLTQGIFWGAIWAYRVLGWGGYWAWDPVENSSLLPWLTLSALMHSVMIQEARRGMKLWNILLAFITFEFVILGTFITRSGVISSVHAFGQSNLTLPFMAMLVGVPALTLWIIYERRGYIKSEDVIESVASKEATFLFNNLILVTSALTVFWGTIFPLISEGVAGYKVTIGPPFYNQVITPLDLLLVVLLGFCIAFPWRRARGEDLVRRLRFPAAAFAIGLITSLALQLRVEMAVSLSIFLFSLTTHIQQYVWDTSRFREEYGNLSSIKVILRRRRRYGGYTAHLGLLIVFIGVAGGVYTQTFENVHMSVGEQKTFGDYTLVYRGLQFEESDLKVVWYANVEIWKGGEFLGVLRPAIEKYKTGSGEEIRRVDIYTEFPEDLYLIFNGASENSALFEVKIEPTVNLIWLGCWILTAGGLFALIPRRLVSDFVFKAEGGVRA